MDTTKNKFLSGILLKSYLHLLTMNEMFITIINLANVVV